MSSQLSALRPKRAYMDKTDFDHELGETDVKLYPSVQAVSEACESCVRECGIVEVEVRLVEISQPGTSSDRSDDSYEETEAVKKKVASSLRARIAELRLKLEAVEGAPERDAGAGCPATRPIDLT